MLTFAINSTVFHLIFAEPFTSIRLCFVCSITFKDGHELLAQAFDALPDGAHKQIVTIKGIGKQTAAAIVATAIDIERFETDKQFTGYYGVFPMELQSGVDKLGRPIPPGKKSMCRKGNDMVRGLLWQCAKCASGVNGGNPAVRALYARRLATGDSADEKTETSGPRLETHKESACEEVTEISASLEPVAPELKAEAPASESTHRQPIDYKVLRDLVPLQQVLERIGRVPVQGVQHRGPCPIHEPQATTGRKFSANLKRQVFRCFDSGCGVQGNVLDLWQAYKKLDLYATAEDLAKTFGVAIPYLRFASPGYTENNAKKSRGHHPPGS